MTAYCDWCRTPAVTPIHAVHHATEHGIPPTTDNVLFARFCYEILQAGLSWDLILKRREGLHAVWHDFDVDMIAGISDSELLAITTDPRNIRHRQKAFAIRANACEFQALARENGTACAWLYGQNTGEMQRVFRTHFKFAGPVITHEFLMGVGMLAGAHASDCPCYATCIEAGAAWAVREGVVIPCRGGG